MHSHQVKIIAAVLAAIGLGLTYAKVATLGMPLLPGDASAVWMVEARVEFRGSGRSAIVNLDIPDHLGAFTSLDELFVSRNYGLNIETTNADRRAEWSIRRAKGMQRLYYHLELAPVRGGKTRARATDVIELPIPPEYAEPFQSAATDLLNDVRNESADIFTFVSQLLARMNQRSPEASVEVVRKGVEPGTDEWVERVVYLLAGARIPARLLRGIVLEEGMTNADLQPWLEVYNGERWEGFDPLTGDKGYLKNFLRWSQGSDPLLTISGGQNAHVKFAVTRQARASIDIARDVAKAVDSPLTAWSLFNLPINTQNLYRILLMIPIGAIAVVLFRNFIGIPTFGTFMPVLIALAFRETELLWGIMLLCIVVAMGLILRFYLERLRLLLVPRLSVGLVMVVLLMLLISLVSNKLHLDRGFSIALFPIVIMTMVIERMSIVWSERGHAEAMKEGLGSLLVASVGYLLMINPYLGHLIFYFPELLLVVLAGFMLAGRYTGYRLSELIRFRDLADGSHRHDE